MQTKKAKIVGFMVIGAVLYCCGIGLLSVPILKDLFEISDGAAVLMNIVAVVAIIAGTGFACASIWMKMHENKEAQIAEKDERNIAIRGKAAQAALLTLIFLYLALTLVLVALQFYLAACLVAIVNMAGAIYLIGHYSKKM
jgi:uncharacterized membrane protein YcjF (UPF0283 family)